MRIIIFIMLPSCHHKVRWEERLSSTAGVSMSRNSQDMQHKREKGRREGRRRRGREERGERREEGEAKCVFDLKMLKQMSIWE